MVTVDDAGPGAEAGLEPDDVIVSVGQRAVATPAALRRAIDDVRVGYALRLGVLRGHGRVTITVLRR